MEMKELSEINLMSNFIFYIHNLCALNSHLTKVYWIFMQKSSTFCRLIYGMKIVKNFKQINRKFHLGMEHVCIKI